MPGTKYVIVPSQTGSGIFYVREGDGKNTNLEVAHFHLMPSMRCSRLENHGSIKEVNDFIEQFKMVIPEWFHR